MREHESITHLLNPAEAPPAGFPHAPVGWSPEEALATAAREGLTLGEDHWAVIQALQAYYARNPTVHLRELHDALDEHFHLEGGLRYLYELFPGGPVNQGCRLAGLKPPPGAEDPAFGATA
ncbi:TusE/DsrC/DsvC family sulfur relay protein [Inmirania thermothiophila]|uniref:Sulfurtransferase n=1 Tax=Inmirania thermothiophila TaxID=1750597 RepID=A0A3N1Y0P4_9GAMM|nr:TusE/DsrC/DsvC family sulfur relay protein [Inmirania thermothiophila]ROR32409.1 tRNA 2-thiouridine synthesizing protein E [Inmirania thermothiophila]